MSNPIVVGVDPQRQSEAPLHLAAALSRMLAAPLVAVTSYLLDPITSARSGGWVDEVLQADATQRLEALATGIDAELVVRGGTSPAHVLHDVAVARSASMIVVGMPSLGVEGSVVLRRSSRVATVVQPAIATDDRSTSFADRRNHVRPI
jgi:nucleotide-binding universal stress UspA family protein